MATVPAHAVFTRWGKNDTPTSRTGSSTGMLWIPNDADGNQVEGSLEITDVETEHKTRGIKYQILDKRNAAEGQLNTPFTPENAGLQLQAATQFESTELPAYHQIEQYWTDNIVSGSGTGRQLLGVLPKALSFTIDKDAGGHIALQHTMFVNQDIQVTAAPPTPTFPSQDPYTQIRTFIDVEFADSAGAFSAWSGNDSSIKSISLNFDNQTEVRGHNTDADANLDLSWDRAIPGPRPTAEGDISFFFEDSVKENYGRGNFIQKMRIRMMGHGTNPSGDGTTEDSLTAGTSVVVTLDSVSGFAVNDVVILIDSANSKEAVATISALSTTNTTITLDELDVDIDGSVTAALVKNTAWEIKVHEANLQGRPQIRNDGNAKMLQMSYQAVVASGQTNLLAVHSYDDDGS